MEDYISREAVIEAIDFYNGMNEQHFSVENLKEDISALPSVQPKEIYNKGWKDGSEATAYHVELCEKENPTIPMAVIEDIKTEINKEITNSTYNAPCAEMEYRCGLFKAHEIIARHIEESEG